LFIAILPAALNLPAYNPFIQNYTLSDGLPSNTVYQIYQDSKKFIWFAMADGLVRYDGLTFTIYRKKDGLSHINVYNEPPFPESTKPQENRTFCL
jgi:ligand-binding sensor domain-containing protein